MNHFETFCKATPKNKHGYVPDAIDLESNSIKDLAIVSYLRDNGRSSLAGHYNFLSEIAKNDLYSKFESAIQDAIDKFNDRIDYEKRLEKESGDNYFDKHWKFTGTNAAMVDAGFKPSDFC